MKINNLDLFREGLYELAHGLNSIADSLDEPEEVEEPEVKVEPEEVVPEVGVEPEVKVEPEPEVEEEVVELKKEVLEGLTYNELQKLAKDLGKTAIGKRDEIVERILGEPIEDLSEDIIETVVEPVIEPVTEEVEEDIEEDEEEIGTVVETKADKIARALDAYTEEDLADVLDSVGVSPKGKRQALIAKIVKAVEDGLLELEFVDEDEVEEPVDETMTEARAKRIPEVKEELEKLVEDGTLTEEALDDNLGFVNEDYNKEIGLREKIDLMKEVFADLVDDDGVSQELQTPYLRAEVYACCTKDLEKLDNGNLHCVICDQEYEID